MIPSQLFNFESFEQSSQSLNFISIGSHSTWCDIYKAVSVDQMKFLDLTDPTIFFALDLALLSIMILKITSDVYCEDTGIIKGHPNCRPSQEIVYFADKNNCTAYYSCLGPDAYHHFCPDGLEYNEAEMICDYQVDAGCSIIRDFAECQGESSPIIPDPHDCRAYYLCESGTAYKNYCPPELEYNEAAKVCDYPEKAMCSYIFKYPGCQVGTESFEPHPKDCSAYYYCRANGDAVRNNCPDGFLFSRPKQLCDYPELVSC